MSLAEQLSADLKEAMRAGDAHKRDTLRMVLSDLKNKRIELGKELGEEEVQGVLAKAVKSREDSVAQYREAGRTDLAEKEEAEVRVIAGYLPQRLGEGETRALVEGVIAELGLDSPKQMGQVMKAVLATHRSQVDGKLVQRLAAELLK